MSAVDMEDDNDWPLQSSSNAAPETAYSYRAVRGDDTDDELERIDKMKKWVEEDVPERRAAPRGDLIRFDDGVSFDDALKQVGRAHEGGAKRRRVNRCWGCQCGVFSSEQPADSAVLKGLVRLIRENHGKMADSELSLIVAQYHEEQIRRPAADAGLQCDAWPPDMVLRHIRYHTLDPRIVLGENITTLRCVIRESRKKVVRRNDDTGEETVDTKTVDTILRSMKTLIDLYSKNPDTMLFGSKNMAPECADDDYVISHRRALTNK